MPSTTAPQDRMLMDRENHTIELRAATGRPLGGATWRSEPGAQMTVQLWSEHNAGGARVSALMLRKVLDEARRQRMTTVATSMELGARETGPVLDDLRAWAREDLASIELRRAGSSVLIEVVLGTVGV